VKKALVVAPIATALLAASCSTTEDGSETAAQDTTTQNSATLDNCGVEIHVDTPVQRAVALEQGASDTLLMLGASEQIAGVGHQKDNPPDGLPKPKAIADQIPTAEQIRAADADFIYSPFELVWTADSAGTREEWQKAGVATYLTNTECSDYGENAGKNSFELIERDLTELGQLFGHEDKVAELIEQQRDTLDKAQQAPDGTTFMLLYSSLGGAPYVAGGPSIVTEMGRAVNMTNVFEDVKEEWPQVSWEEVAQADPDVIVIADLPVRGEPGDTWQEKVTDLENNPGTREMQAVKKERYIVVPGVATSASARSYQAVQAMSDAITSGIADN